jgi:hypothetical protein
MDSGNTSSKSKQSADPSSMINTTTTPKEIGWASLSRMTESLFAKFGAFDGLLLFVSLTCGVARKLVPELGNETSSFVLDYFNYQVDINSFLSIVALISLWVMIVLLTIKVLGGILLNVFKKIIIVVRYILSILLSIFILIARIVPKPGSGKFFWLIANFRDRMKYLSEKIYANPIWVAEGMPAQILNIPISARNFKSAECDLQIVEKPNNYWRAGITFGKDEDNKYLFHFYEDTQHAGVLKCKIFTKRSNQIVTDTSKIVSKPGDIDNFSFRLLKVGSDKLRFFFNDRTIGTYELPFSDLQDVYLSAWGDGRPYKINFKNKEKRVTILIS